MITLEQARSRAQVRLTKKLRDWAVVESRLPPVTEPGTAPGTEPPCWSLGLQPPSEAEVRRDERSAQEWARSWQAAHLPPGVAVRTVVRAWRSIGRQTVPERLDVHSPEALAAFVGGPLAREFRVLGTRAAEAATRLGESSREVLRRHGAVVVGLSPERWEQVLDVAAWLCENPVAGLRPRALPIRGVDTKWFAAHRSLVTALVAARTGLSDLGVVDSDPLVRLRILDPDLALGGVEDFAAPLSQLEVLSLRPEVTLVVENKETLLALPPLAGVVAVHGGGFAISVVADLPWVAAAPVLYWGDLDSAGFAILHRLRAHHDRVTSVLMDDETLLAHRDLWVCDPKPTRALLGNLTSSEARVLALLQAEGDVRLEQERVPLAAALESLRRALVLVAPPS